MQHFSTTHQFTFAFVFTIFYGLLDLLFRFCEIELKLDFMFDSQHFYTINICKINYVRTGKTDRTKPVTGTGISSSPHNSFCSALQYPASKVSFTNTEKSDVRGDVEESEKPSMYRSSTVSGVSDESSTSSSSSDVYKPHNANDSRWEAIQAVRSRVGALGLTHFRLLRQLGCGDIGRVYLLKLIGTWNYFAMKVMDKTLLSPKKLLRAQTERKILQSLDHPFLPTLYSHFDTEKFSCLVMDFCNGGDLRMLMQKQPGKFFSENAVRFYAAEVLLALEYLHMLGIIYRDLKPENVLVREDGHIMLSDFDLSLRCSVSPTLVRSANAGLQSKNSNYCMQPACTAPPSCVIQPSCIKPTCFCPQFLPPDIITRNGQSITIDWWQFGVFVHKLLFGVEPCHSDNGRLVFPRNTRVSFGARDLITGLLLNPRSYRLGNANGAVEIKKHAFFNGVDWENLKKSSPGRAQFVQPRAQLGFEFARLPSDIMFNIANRMSPSSLSVLQSLCMSSKSSARDFQEVELRFLTELSDTMRKSFYIVKCKGEPLWFIALKSRTAKVCDLDSQYRIGKTARVESVVGGWLLIIGYDAQLYMLNPLMGFCYRLPPDLFASGRHFCYNMIRVGSDFQILVLYKHRSGQKARVYSTSIKAWSNVNVPNDITFHNETVLLADGLHFRVTSPLDTANTVLLIRYDPWTKEFQRPVTTGMVFPIEKYWQIVDIGGCPAIVSYASVVDTHQFVSIQRDPLTVSKLFLPMYSGKVLLTLGEEILVDSSTTICTYNPNGKPVGKLPKIAEDKIVEYIFNYTAEGCVIEGMDRISAVGNEGLFDES